MFSLFGKKSPPSAAVIDLSSSSVGGALIAFPDNATPIIPFSVRVPIEFPDNERTTLSMLRSLDTLMAELTAKGIPALKRDTGASHPDRVYLAIGSPWQETSIDIHTETAEKPFVFTRDMLAKALTRPEPLPEGKKELQKEVLATMLNGYRVTEPFGKRVERAEIIVLSSIVDGDAMALSGKSAKRLRPKNGVLLAPFESVAYEVLCAQYPHEKDFLLIHVSEESTSILFADAGIVIDAAHVPVGLSSLAKTGGNTFRSLPINGTTAPAPEDKPDASAENAWVEGASSAFKKFAERHALPRILFLVSDETAADALKKLFDTPAIHSLWLSDEPLTVIPVVSRLLSSLIKHQGDGVPDAALDLIGLFASLRLSAKRK